MNRMDDTPTAEEPPADTRTFDERIADAVEKRVEDEGGQILRRRSGLLTVTEKPEPEWPGQYL